MMFRLTMLPVSILLIMAFTLLVAGCSSSAENPASKPVVPNNTTTSTSSPDSNTPRAKLNVNTASESEFLSAIPGLGNRMVHEFEEYRPYRSIQQFRKEIGKYVKPEQVAEYEKYVFVPINENEADAPTLQQIPGLDAAEVQPLITGRPYASRDTFLTNLAEKISEADLVVAKTYLIAP